GQSRGRRERRGPAQGSYGVPNGLEDIHDRVLAGGDERSTWPESRRFQSRDRRVAVDLQVRVDPAERVLARGSDPDVRVVYLAGLLLPRPPDLPGQLAVAHHEVPGGDPPGLAQLRVGELPGGRVRRLGKVRHVEDRR